LEPLGFIGLAVRDRVIYDNPGLGSKLAFEAVKQFGWGFGAVKILKADFIVLRRWELRILSRDMADVVAQYEEVAHIHGKHDYSIDIEAWYMRCRSFIFSTENEILGLAVPCQGPDVQGDV